jgi:hypothetical protein
MSSALMNESGSTLSGDCYNSRIRSSNYQSLAGKAGMEFEYLVCQTQFSRVTFVNGAWQGTVPLASGDSQAALDSCPLIWDYLAWAGRDGWELVTTTHSALGNSETTPLLACQLFLKRQRR